MEAIINFFTGSLNTVAWLYIFLPCTIVGGLYLTIRNRGIQFTRFGYAMKNTVGKMFEKQGITIGTADDMWKALASGNFTADADTIAKAKEDISEDGYWGVKQTSSRIFDFAMALAGDDEEKMQKMKAAVEKGFKLATKSWGKELPDISKNTYSAVMDKFDDYFASKKTSTDTE